MPAPPPLTRYSTPDLFEMELVITERLKKFVHEQYMLRVVLLRDLAIDGYRIGVDVINKDWSLHGRLEDTVHDPKEFPSDLFRTQLIMLAG